MSFYSQYELLEPVPGGTVRTFKARQLASGRDVLVHLIVAGGESLDWQLAGLTPEKRAQILDSGIHEGTRYVVSTALPAGVKFEEWLAAPPVSAPPHIEDVGSRVGKWDISRLHPATTGAPPPKPSPAR